jgi:hypothetical protein
VKPERFFRRHGKVLLLAALCAAIAVAGWRYLRSGLESCATVTVAVIPGPGSFNAKVIETGCWGIVGDATVGVVLSPRNTGRDVAVLKYGLDETSRNLSLRGAMPEVTWLGRDRLKIALKAAGSIDKKIAAADGVRIEYDVGVVEFR